METDLLGYWCIPTGIKPWMETIYAIINMSHTTISLNYIPSLFH